MSEKTELYSSNQVSELYFPYLSIFVGYARPIGEDFNSPISSKLGMLHGNRAFYYLSYLDHRYKTRVLYLCLVTIVYTPPLVPGIFFYQEENKGNWERAHSIPVACSLTGQPYFYSLRGRENVSGHNDELLCHNLKKVIIALKVDRSREWNVN